jgi:uncharacterized protein (TIGR02646 family)
MKRLLRQPLSSSTLALLRSRSEAVAGSIDPRAEVELLWGRQSNKAFREIREVLREMASGVERCMYCEDSKGIAIDHFWPKTQYPDRAFDWLNYLLACTTCNSLKRQQFPLDEQNGPLLLNPTEEDPFDHLSFLPAEGDFSAKTPKGNWSIQVYCLNRRELMTARSDAWDRLQGLIVAYAHLLQQGHSEFAARIEQTVRRHPFAGVFAALARFANGPNPAALIRPLCLAAIQQHPAILSWA